MDELGDYDVHAGDGELEAHLEAFADENERLKKSAAAYREEWHKAGQMALRYRATLQALAFRLEGRHISEQTQRELAAEARDAITDETGGISGS